MRLKLGRKEHREDFISAAPWLGTFIAGGVAAGLAWLRLTSVGSEYWIARDDAVIIFSHARNLVEFGSIGVSPGDRVEGFSSPLQFLLSALILAFRDLGFETINLIILVLAMAGIGASAFAVFHQVARSSPPSRGLLKGVPYVATVVFILGFALHWTSLGWVASGMENAPALALMVASIAAFPLARRPGAWPALPSVVLGLLAVSRVDLAAFISPLFMALMLEAVSDLDERNADDVGAQQDWGGRLRRLAVACLPGGLIILIVHIFRRWYFGAWLPNTAIVQDRFDGAGQILVLIVFNLLVISMVVSTFFVSHRLRLVFRTSAFVLLLISAWIVLSGRTTSQLEDLVEAPALYLVFACAACIVFVQRQLGLFDVRRMVLFVSVLFVPIGQFLVMGTARLDDYRVVSLAVPVLLLWLVTTLVDVTGAERTSKRTPVFPVAAAWVLVIGLSFSGLLTDSPRVLNWGVEGYTQVRKAAVKFRDEKLAPTSLPIVANPDLGKLSFHKDVLMVDLGWLGDPVLAKLWNDDPDLAIEYLNRIAVPDVVELHDYWSCQYAAYLGSEAFQTHYQPTSSTWLEVEPPDSTCPYDGRYIIWERQSAPEEFSLVKAISGSTEPVLIVERALADCLADGDDPLRCQHVRRAVHRSIADLRESGQWNAVIDVFAVSPTLSLDIALLRRGSGWADRAVKEVGRYLGTDVE
jgi:hypothetical protein